MAVLKSCEVVQEFAPKLKILFLKNCVSLTEVWAISESCEVVQTAHVSSPTCASHLLQGLLCGHLDVCPFRFVRVQVTSIYTFIWIAGFYPVIVCKVTCSKDHSLTSSICVQSLIWGIRCCPVKNISNRFPQLLSEAQHKANNKIIFELYSHGSYFCSYCISHLGFVKPRLDVM